MPSKNKRLVVLATGDLAIPILEAVVEAGHEVLTIVSHQPVDSGERAILPEERQGSALAAWARGRGVEIRRAAEPGGDRVRQTLEELAPDLGLVAAYGRSFPAALLEIPQHGWIKVHHSNLPKNRGLHPIRSALWRGEKHTGATVIQVTEETDAGPILEQEKVAIEAHETFGQLAPRVAAAGAQLVVPAIRKICRKSPPKMRKQNARAATKTPNFGVRHRVAPWWRKADLVYARLLALSPEPGMTTRIQGREVRILEGGPANHVNTPIAETGSFVGIRSGSAAILCANGTVFAIDLIETAEGKRVSASSFFKEHGVRVGTVVV